MPSARAVIPAAVAACGVLLAGTLYVLGYHSAYHAVLQYWGAFPFRVPFLDMHGVTAAIDCHRRGFDIYVQNPCDVFGRVHAYSPAWLWLGALPITTGWDVAAGLTSVVLFVAALAFLPPGRGTWQTAVMTVCTVSSTVAYALERANVDLVTFVLAVVAVALVRRRGRWRIAGYAIALLAAMLKFYPVTLLILAVRERLAMCIAVCLAWIGVLALWFVLDARDILRSMANIPNMDYHDNNVFGVRDLPFGLSQTLGLPHSVSVALLMVLLAAMLGCALAVAARNNLRLRVCALTEAEAMFLLLGCSLVIGCFFAAQNGLYRAIFLLFVVPGLTALVQPGRRQRADRWLQCVVGLVVLLMWKEPVRALASEAAAPPLLVWLVLEVGWWLLVTALSAIMMRLLWQTRAVRAVFETA